MLEAVKGQTIAVRMLTNDLARNTFPNTLIFHGPDGSGKFFAALELTRILKCEGSGAPNCNCDSCRAIRELSSPTVYIITKSRMDSIFQLWRHVDIDVHNLSSFQYDLKRLLLHASPKSRLKKEWVALAEWVSYGNDLLTHLDEVFNTVSLILEKSVKDITIDEIRDLKRFLFHKSSEQLRRVAIIDGAEHMNEEAANSFLKISEDTPSNALIIMTTIDKKKVKETVRSRARAYRFVPLSRDVSLFLLQAHLGCDRDCLEIWEKKGYSKVVPYVDRLREAGHNARQVLEITREIVKAGIVKDFIEYCILEEGLRIRKKDTVSIGDSYEIEFSLNTLFNLKKRIFSNNANQELALLEYLLNLPSLC